MSRALVHTKKEDWGNVDGKGKSYEPIFHVDEDEERLNLEEKYDRRRAINSTAEHIDSTYVSLGLSKRVVGWVWEGRSLLGKCQVLSTKIR